MDETLQGDPPIFVIVIDKISCRELIDKGRNVFPQDPQDPAVKISVSDFNKRILLDPQITERLQFNLVLSTHVS